MCALGIEKGYYSSHVLCSVSGRVPAIPVKLDGKLYDLFHLTKEIKALPGRETPYAYTFRGKFIDSRDIQFDKTFSRQLIKYAEQEPAWHLKVDFACTLFYYNNNYLLPFLSINAFLYFLLKYSSEPTCPATPILHQDAMVGLYAQILLVYLKLFFFLSKLSTPTHRGDTTMLNNLSAHENYYIHLLAKCNEMYCGPHVVLGLIYPAAKYAEVDIPIFIPEEFESTQLPIVNSALYLLSFALYTVFALINNSPNKSKTLFTTPSHSVCSPVFEREDYLEIEGRRDARKELLLTFNRFSKTNRGVDFDVEAQNNKMPFEVTEKILEFAFGQKPSRYRYTKA